MSTITTKHYSVVTSDSWAFLIKNGICSRLLTIAIIERQAMFPVNLTQQFEPDSSPGCMVLSTEFNRS